MVVGNHDGHDRLACCKFREFLAAGGRREGGREGGREGEKEWGVLSEHSRFVHG